jgi:hypothetical protein
MQCCRVNPATYMAYTTELDFAGSFCVAMIIKHSKTANNISVIFVPPGDPEGSTVPFVYVVATKGVHNRFGGKGTSLRLPRAAEYTLLPDCTAF